MKASALRIIPIAIAVVAVSACAGVRKTTTDVNPRIDRAPTCANAIAVYSNRSAAPFDYYELAWIEACLLYTSPSPRDS